MKIAVERNMYNYSGGSSHRTSDGWFRGDYSIYSLHVHTIGYLTETDIKKIKQFEQENIKNEYDSRSDGPIEPITIKEYDKDMTMMLAQIWHCEIIDKNDSKENIRINSGNDQVRYNIVECEYINGNICGNKGRKWLINTDESQIFDDIIMAKDYGYICVQNGRYGLINNEGTFILPLLYSCITKPHYSDDLILRFPYPTGKYCSTLHSTFKFTAGHFDIPSAMADGIIEFNDNQIVCFKANKYGIFSIDGSILLPYGEEEVELCNDKLYYLVTGNHRKPLYFDATKNLKGRSFYKMFLLCEDTLIFDVQNEFDTKHALYSLSDNRLLSEFIYSSFCLFENKFIIATREAKKGVFDLSGQCIFGCEYDDFEVITDEFAVVQNKRKKGIVFLIEHYNIPCIYDNIVYAGNGYVAANNGGGNL